MITPVIIQIVFWVGVAGCVIAGLVAIVSGAGSRYGGGSQILSGFMLIILGPVGVRIYCELLIVIFKINDSLTDIRNHKLGIPAPASYQPQAAVTREKSACQSCGRAVEPEAKFCENCGQKLS
jgi:membrane protease subunit (stomatin/prohibitin family)